MVTWDGEVGGVHEQDGEPEGAGPQQPAQQPHHHLLPPPALLPGNRTLIILINRTSVLWLDNIFPRIVARYVPRKQSLPLLTLRLRVDFVFRHPQTQTRLVSSALPNLWLGRVRITVCTLFALTAIQNTFKVQFSIALTWRYLAERQPASSLFLEPAGDGDTRSEEGHLAICFLYTRYRQSMRWW